MTDDVNDWLQIASETIAERGRERDRADGERSMARAVRAFNALYSEQIAAQHGLLDEADGWAFMDILKRARGRSRDDLVDGIAYRALEAESMSRDNGE